jgi:hypothetical protein
MHDDELDRELHRLFTDDRLALPVADDAERQIRSGIARRRRRRGTALAVAGALIAVGAVFGATAISPGGVSDRAEPPPNGPTLSVGPHPTGAAPTGRTGTRPTQPGGTSAPRPTGQTGAPPPPGQTGSGGTAAAAPGGGGQPTGGAQPPPRFGVTSAVLGPFGIGPLQLGMSESEAVATGALGPPSPGGACHSYPVNGPGVTAEISPSAGLTSFVASSGARTPEGVTIGTSRAEVVRLYSLQQSRGIAVETAYADAPGNPAAQYAFSFNGNDQVSSFALRLKSGGC